MTAAPRPSGVSSLPWICALVFERVPLLLPTGVPKLYSPVCKRVSQDFRRRGPIDFADDGRLMGREEPENRIQRCHERARQFGVGCLSDDHQKRDAVGYDRGKLVGFVSYPAVVGEGDPAVGGNSAQPHVVCAIVKEMVGVSLHGKSAGSKDVGKL